MKERPILFSGPMVNAIRDGRKTQTRRKVKLPIKDPLTGCDVAGCEANSLLRQGDKLCPYGQPGDRMWCKETWATSQACDERPPRNMEKPGMGYGWPVWYAADGAVNTRGRDGLSGGPGFTTKGKQRPSLFMPRWASRILLEITAVRVERLQDISEKDAKAEGCYPTNRAEGTLFAGSTHPIKGTPKVFPCAKAAYRDLWESINGPGSWEVNPWVWAIEFKVLEGDKR